MKQILIVLSLLGSCFGVIYGLSASAISSLDHQTVADMVREQGLAQDVEQMVSLVYAMAENGVWYAVFSAIEVVGLLLMFSGRDLYGFHAYAASQIGMAGLMWIIAGPGALTYTLWCLLWTYVYSRLTIRK